MKGHDEEAARSVDPKSWNFWRKRLARGLVVGALGLTAAQILPALPEDQVVLLIAPTGVQLTRAQLTYFSKEDGEAIAGTELVPTEPAGKLTHLIRLPSSDYVISLVASAADGTTGDDTYSLTRTVHLSGSTTKIYLKASKTPD